MNEKRILWVSAAITLIVTAASFAIYGLNNSRVESGIVGKETGKEIESLRKAISAMVEKHGAVDDWNG